MCNVRCAKADETYSRSLLWSLRKDNRFQRRAGTCRQLGRERFVLPAE